MHTTTVPSMTSTMFIGISESKCSLCVVIAILLLFEILPAVICFIKYTLSLAIDNFSAFLIQYRQCLRVSMVVNNCTFSLLLFISVYSLNSR